MHHVYEWSNNAKSLLPRDGSKFLVCLTSHFTAFGSCLVHFRPEWGAADGDVPDRNDQLSVQGHLRVELLDKLEKNWISFTNVSYLGVYEHGFSVTPQTTPQVSS